MLQRNWEQGKEVYYLEANVTVVGTEKWPFLQQFQAEDPQAIFEYDKDQQCFWIRDLSIESGTRVNGIPISKVHSARLKNGDRIGFGFSPDYTFNNVSSNGHHRTGYHNYNNFEQEPTVNIALPKLRRGRAQSPRTLPVTAILVEPDSARRSPSPKSLANAYRRRIFRAGSFEGHQKPPKAVANAWVPEKVHYSSYSSPSHSTSWDGQIEKQSPRSRGAFVNTQQSLMIAEMQNKISHLESLLHENNSTKTHVPDESSKTVELAHQILELRSQLNKKEDEVRSLKEKNESDLEYNTMKMEFHKLKSALTNSEKVRSKLESDSDSKVYNLVNSYGDHGHLKYPKLLHHDHDGILDSARSVDSSSTLNVFNDSSDTFGLFNGKHFKEDLLQDKVKDQKVQLKLYEMKISELEKKLHKTVEDIEFREKHIVRDTLDSINNENRLTTLQEENRFLNQQKNNQFGKAELCRLLINTLNQLSNHADENEITIESQFGNSLLEYVEKNKNNLQQNHVHNDDAEDAETMQAIFTSAECAEIYETTKSLAFTFLEQLKDLKSLQHDQILENAKYNSFNRLLTIIRDEIDEIMNDLDSGKLTMDRLTLKDVQEKVENFDKKLEESMPRGELSDDEVQIVLNWTQNQLRGAYEIMAKFCPVFVSVFQNADEFASMKDRFQNFLKNLEVRLSGSKNNILESTFEIIKNSGLQDDWFTQSVETLLNILATKIRMFEASKFDAAQNTDLSHQYLDELNDNIESGRIKEETYEKQLQELQQLLDEAKLKLSQTEHNYKTIVEQSEEFKQTQIDRSQCIIDNLNVQIETLKEQLNSNDTNSGDQSVMQNQLDELKVENENLKKEILSLSQKTALFEKEKSDFQKTLNSLNVELQSARENSIVSRSSNEDDLKELKAKLELLENSEVAYSNASLTKEINVLKKDLNVKDQTIRELRNELHVEKLPTSDVSKENPKITNGLDPNGSGSYRSSFFDGPFQDAANHLNDSHGTLVNSFRRPNDQRRVDDDKDNDMFWNLSQRLASMLDLDLKRQELASVSPGNSTDAVKEQVITNDKVSAAHEISDKVEELLRRIRQQNDELVTAREQKPKSDFENDNNYDSNELQRDEPKVKLSQRPNSGTKGEKRKKQEMPMKVVTFKLPE